MSQHFLLSAKARTVSIMDVFRMSDTDIWHLFRKLRWESTHGKPVCPECGGTCHYHIKGRKQWRCKACSHTFSVTSGTIFAHHKKPLRVYLLAIVLLANGAKSKSALELSRDLDVQYKTAWVLSHKIRESLLLSRNEKPLSGTIEIDGLYVGNYLRPANNIEDRVDGRKVPKPNKRSVIVFKERSPSGGSARTLTAIEHGEAGFAIRALADRFVIPGSEIHTDEHSAYDDLEAKFEMHRVNHQFCYAGPSGENNNQCESFNARFRRMQYGQMHRIGTLYLSNYANEIAYKEDTARWSNGRVVKDMLRRCLDSHVSNELCGYWQGNKRMAERIGA